MRDRAGGLVDAGVDVHAVDAVLDAANGAALAREWRFTEEDRYLATLPLFHVHGLANGVHCWLISGCHLRLTERFDHAKAAGWFEDYRPTVFFGVPAMFIRLLELPAEVARAISEMVRGARR